MTLPAATLPVPTIDFLSSFLLYLPVDLLAVFETVEFTISFYSLPQEPPLGYLFPPSLFWYGYYFHRLIGLLIKLIKN